MVPHTSLAKQSVVVKVLTDLLWWLRPKRHHQLVMLHRKFVPVVERLPLIVFQRQVQILNGTQIHREEHSSLQILRLRMDRPTMHLKQLMGVKV